MTSTPTTLSLKKIYSGKVRDLYEIDDKRMLMVATDRLSAFDVVLPTGIPRRGEVLTFIPWSSRPSLGLLLCHTLPLLVPPP